MTSIGLGVMVPFRAQIAPWGGGKTAMTSSTHSGVGAVGVVVAGATGVMVAGATGVVMVGATGVEVAGAESVQLWKQSLSVINICDNPSS